MQVRYRRSHGVSQKRMAGLTGIDPTTLGKVENGKGGCFPSTIEKVSTFLDAHDSMPEYLGGGYLSVSLNYLRKSAGVHSNSSAIAAPTRAHDCNL